MNYLSLMVHLELERPNTGLLEIAGQLAERFHAHVIGIAACQSMRMVYGGSYVSLELAEQDREEIGEEMRDAEAEFRSALLNRVKSVEWRSSAKFASIADYLATQSRSADLIITGVASGELFDAARALNMGDLVMHAGRPVLIVPNTTDTLRLDNVVIGWKETRETRRAVFDALPLLRNAEQVTVIAIAREVDLAEASIRLADVVDWLRRHGVDAGFLASPSTGDDIARLNLIAQEHNADLIVAGAYGHRRLHDWTLGGVTGDLLLSANRCALVSH
ncbi:universal stress protein [uncultured Nevskia sp.]|uniref:universal stress protein n=1 Tax=uncultured Nevskia sp. TaxID=228950 RepID=UPI0025F1C4DF|nr:universal stress protein [uncultured Nevskia sp.]